MKQNFITTLKSDLSWSILPNPRRIIDYDEIALSVSTSGEIFNNSKRLS